LANLYMRRGQYEKAREVLTDFGEKDIYNDRVEPTLKNIDRIRTMDSRRVELEELINEEQQQKAVRPENLLELVRIYGAMQKNNELVATVRSVIASQPAPQFLLQLAQQLAGIRRFDLAEPVLTQYLSQKPEDSRVWVELAAIRIANNRTDPALAAIQKAVEQGGTAIRSVLQKDARFRPLYNHPRFRSLVPPAAPKKQIPFNTLF
ncbi:MAG TPA: tetratricopeptide repeat protein, partial [Tichowtungia sp.]|nr:tetratricopeptide repeat protein [Tichowtungia sp.]